MFASTEKSGHKNMRRPARGIAVRGFSLLLLLAATASALLLSGVSANDERGNQTLYTDWQLQQSDSTLSDADISSNEYKIGSFTIARSETEIFTTGLTGVWQNAITPLLSAQAYQRYLRHSARQHIISDNAEWQPADWLDSRVNSTGWQLAQRSADYLSDYVLITAEDYIESANFVRNVEFDLQTSLGDRRWQTGASALGALREKPDSATVWQLRSYVADESVGVNAGLIQRHAIGNNLVGMNIFWDVEREAESDETFYRWSIGTEFRSEWADLHANRYISLTDGVQNADGSYYYSQSGWDAELRINAHLDDTAAIPSLSGGIGYYLWEGEYGDEDDKGLRYFIAIKQIIDNFEIVLEHDVPNEGSAEWGGKIIFAHRFGAPASGGAGVSNSTFNPRDHFYAPVRREYAQRIRRSSGGYVPSPDIVAVRHAGEAVVFGAPVTVASQTPTSITLNATTPSVAFQNAVDLTASTGSGATLALSSEAGKWLATLHTDTDVMLDSSGTLLSLIAGTVLVERDGGNLSTLAAGDDLTVVLNGTRLMFGHDGAGGKVSVELFEGEIALTVASAEDATVFLRDGIIDWSNTDTANSVENLTVGCSSIATRANITTGLTLSCMGDAYLTALPVDATVILARSGAINERVTLTENGGNINDGTRDWSEYPFALLSNGDIYASAPAGSSIVFNYTRDTLRGTVDVATVALSGTITVRVAPPGDSQVVSAFLYAGHVNINGSSYDCADVASNNSEGIGTDDLRLYASCGDIFFALPIVNNVFGNRGSNSSHTYTVSGGDGEYLFELQNADPSRVSIAGSYLNVVTLEFNHIALGSYSFSLIAKPASQLLQLSDSVGYINNASTGIDVSVVPEGESLTDYSSFIRADHISGNPVIVGVPITLVSRATVSVRLNESHNFSYFRDGIALTAYTDTGGTLALSSEEGQWDATLHADSQVFLDSAAISMTLDTGTMELERDGDFVTDLRAGQLLITMGESRLHVGHAAGNKISIELFAGDIATSVEVAFDATVLVRSGYVDWTNSNESVSNLEIGCRDFTTRANVATGVTVACFGDANVETIPVGATLIFEGTAGSVTLTPALGGISNGSVVISDYPLPMLGTADIQMQASGDGTAVLNYLYDRLRGSAALTTLNLSDNATLSMQNDIGSNPATVYLHNGKAALADGIYDCADLSSLNSGGIGAGEIRVLASCGDAAFVEPLTIVDGALERVEVFGYTVSGGDGEFSYVVENDPHDLIDIVEMDGNVVSLEFYYSTVGFHTVQLIATPTSGHLQSEVSAATLSIVIDIFSIPATMLIVGGYGKSDSWVSDNGFNWLAMGDVGTDRQDGGFTSFDNKFYLVGGRVAGEINQPFYKDVWESRNGASWTRISDGPGDTARRLYDMVVHRTRLILFAASTGDPGSSGEIYESTDGATWSKIADAPFFVGFAPSIESHNNTLYLSAGSSSSGAVWASPDGLVWSQVVPDNGPKHSQNADLVSFKGNLYQLGGFGSDADSNSYMAVTRYAADFSSWDSYKLTNYYAKNGDVIVHQGTLFYLPGRASGGANITAGISDMVYTRDGETWFEGTIDYAPRHNPMAAVRSSVYFDPDAFPSLIHASLAPPPPPTVDITEDEQIIATVTVTGGEGDYTYDLAYDDSNVTLQMSGNIIRLAPGVAENLNLEQFYNIATTMTVDDATIDTSPRIFSFNLRIGRHALELENIAAAITVSATAGLQQLATIVVEQGGSGDFEYILTQSNAGPQLEMVGSTIRLASGEAAQITAETTVIATVNVDDNESYHVLVASTTVTFVLLPSPPLQVEADDMFLLEGEVGTSQVFISGGIAPYNLTLLGIAPPDAAATMFPNGFIRATAHTDSDITLTILVEDGDAGQVKITLEVLAHLVQSVDENAYASGSIYLLGGWNLNGDISGGNIWSSSNGSSWKSEPDFAQTLHAMRAVVFGSYIYTSGGHYNGSAFPSYSYLVTAGVFRGNGSEWSEVASTPFSARFNHAMVTFKNKLYVMGGQNYNGTTLYNDVWSSTNGTDWTDEGTLPTGTLYDFGYAVHSGSLYIFGGFLTVDEDENDTIWATSDGVNWVQRDVGDDVALPVDGAVGASYRGQLFMFGAATSDSSGQLIVSRSGNGENWHQLTLTGADAAHSGVALVHNGTLFYFGGQPADSINPSDEVWYTDDGLSWQQLSDTDFPRLYDGSAVVYDASQAPPDSLLSPVQIIAESLPTEVITLTALTQPLATISADGGFVSAGGSYQYTLSGDSVLAIGASDGVVRFASAAALADLENTLTVTATVLVDDEAAATLALDDVMLTITLTITRDDYPDFTLTNALTQNVAAGNSDTGLQIQPSSGYAPYTYLVEDVLPASAANAVSISSDGNLQVSESLSAGTYTAYVVVSDSAFPPRVGTVAVELNLVDAQMVLVGGSSGSNISDAVWSSSDGIAWTSVAVFPGGARYDHAMAAHNGSLYLVGGRIGDVWSDTRFNDVWRSGDDGVTWVLVTSSAAFSERYHHQLVSHNGSLYVLGGEYLDPDYEFGATQDVWASADGVEWTRVADNQFNVFPTNNERFGATEHNGRIYVTGGQKSATAVWSSADGATWTAHGNTPPHGYGMRLVSHDDGVLHALGGEASNVTVFSASKSSDNGDTWSGHTTVSGMPHHNGDAISWLGKVFYIGGVNVDNTTSDAVWSTADGVTWTEVGAGQTKFGGLSGFAVSGVPVE